MQLRSLPLAASAVAGGTSFLSAAPRPVTERRMHHLRCNADNSSSSSSEKEGGPSPAEEALRRLAELDAQMEGLKEPKMRPPAPPPPPGADDASRARAASKRMQLHSLPLAASAVAGRSFLSAVPRPVTERSMRLRCNADKSSSSSSDKEGEPSPAAEALRRLAELDAQMEGLKEPKMRLPAPPPPPDPFMDREMIIQRGRPSDELPEMTPAYVTFSTLAIFIITIFTNVVFNLYIKPSVDGADEPVRIQRVPLADPVFQQPGKSSDS